MIKLHPTEDGSFTLYNELANENYHSRRGALQEARHVFIEAGLKYVLSQHKTDTLQILEIGFGAGLNALLSAIYIKQFPLINLHYLGVEPLPVPNALWQMLPYPKETNEPDATDCFEQIHQAKWEKNTKIHNLNLLKTVVDLLQFGSEYHNCFDLVYFDAFSPKAQPEMWQPSVFQKIYQVMKPQAKLVTYCAQGQFRRDLRQAGFATERLQGAKGKFEMTRATALKP